MNEAHLNGVASIVDQQDDRIQSVPDHSGQVLQREFEILDRSSYQQQVLTEVQSLFLIQSLVRDLCYMSHLSSDLEATITNREYQALLASDCCCIPQGSPHSPSNAPILHLCKMQVASTNLTQALPSRPL